MAGRQFKKRRASVDYKEEYFLDTPSTSKWTNKDLKDYNIKVINIDNFPKSEIICKELIIPEWKNEDWLYSCKIIDIKVSENKRINNKVKTLVDKIKEIQKYKNIINEIYVDGFMNTMLSIFEFDDYPCQYFPQYPLQTIFGGEIEQTITSKVDFGVISKFNNSAMLVIEDKTMTNADFYNDWKEAQVVGEIFVALHDKNIKTVFGIRVVHTLFTFYKSTIDKDYKVSNLRGIFKQGELIIERFPEINPNELSLNALDICIYDQRIQILERLSFIHNQLSPE